MALFTPSRWHRFGFGAALFVAGVLLLVARPGTALAHHVTITDNASCSGWSTKAEYIGGPADRKMVVDVMINDEHIAQTFYFDNDAGHLGHQNYYLLFQRAGTGSLHTSGTIIMYQKVNGAYTSVASITNANANLTCASTATPVNSATATSTATPILPTNTPTPTPVPPTEIPTSTATVETEGTATPLATDTPEPTSTVTTDDSVTPIATDTATAIATATATSSTVSVQSTSTPESTNTSVSTDNTETPAPGSTPTLVSVVRNSTFPEHPGEDQSPSSPSERALPSTGQGASTPGAIFVGLLGTVLAAIGLGVCASGMRTRGVA